MSTSVTKHLAVMEDFQQGRGEVQQTRGGEVITAHKVDLAISVNSVDELRAIDVVKFDTAKLYSTAEAYHTLAYRAGDNTGVVPDSGVGSWHVVDLDLLDGAMTPLHGGIWQSGQTYTNTNQFMIYAGVTYVVKEATTLPLTIGIAPELTKVEATIRGYQSFTNGVVPYNPTDKVALQALEDKAVANTAAIVVVDDDLQGLKTDLLTWDPAYAPNKSVGVNTIALDNGWLMASNKATTERAAPQPIGDPFFLFDGTLVNTPVSAKQLIFGTRYTFATNGYINGYRVNLVAGQVYQLFLVLDPLGVKEISNILTFTANSSGWQTLTLAPRVALLGATVDLVAVVQEPSGTPTVTVANYSYTTPSADGSPVTGQIRHANSNISQLKIYKTDIDVIDRSALLASLAVGDTISGNGATWTIQATVDSGLWFTFDVVPATQAPSDGTFAFSFTIVTPTPITYGVDTDHWISSASIEGLYIADGMYDDIVPDDNAYGVDLLVQNASIPEDWNVMSTMGISDSGVASQVTETEILGQFSTADTIDPTGLGHANRVNIHFGAGGSTFGDEMTLASDGVFTILKGDVDYEWDITTQIMRAGATGASEIIGRMMYAADGVIGTAIQYGDTFVTAVDNADSIWRQFFTLTLKIPTGGKFWFEIARNNGADNSGGIGTIGAFTGDLVGEWGTTASASVIVRKTNIV